MFSELIEQLRCVRPHEPTALVAAAELVIERDILCGLLGCPSCRTEYPVVGGVADFRDGRAGPPLPPPKARVEEGMAVRAGALLDLVSPGGIAVLAGEWTACAPELAALTDSVRLLGVDAVPGLASGAGISLALTAGELPLRSGSARGIALDAGHATPGYLASAVDALAAKGRLVAPAATPIPAGLTELARDARDWVAERTAAPAVTTLRRAPRAQPPESPEA